jgi:hypothetical protein
MKRKKTKTYESWPCVFEVSDAAGPRRFPGKPRVCVKPKCSKPGSALEQWFSVSEKVEEKKLVSIRYDLMLEENIKGGTNNPFCLPKEKAEADWAIQTLEQSLLRDGYTIWDETSTRRLYVIETYPTEDTPEDKVGCLYVGQTAYPIEERIEQHRLGPEYPWEGVRRYSRDCHKNFKEPRLDWMPEEYRLEFFHANLVLAAESDLRLHFESLGYEVSGGQERYEKRKALPSQKKS